MMDKKSALLRQVWKATTSEVFLIHSSNWMESDAWMQGGKAGTNPKLLVVTEKRENGVSFPGSDLCVFLRVAYLPNHNNVACLPTVWHGYRLCGTSLRYEGRGNR